MARLSNPIAFTRGPVTVIVTIVYIALLTVLILIHTGVPSAPSRPQSGVSIDEAWTDLQAITPAYRPYNSHQNDVIHDLLLLRIQTILVENNVSSTDAYVFNDLQSNLTSSSPGSLTSNFGFSVYFESTNIIVYIRGYEDDEKQWWRKPNGRPKRAEGVLVNAHFDSVSTGFGATDDGVGVVSMLQLIRYYTSYGNKPEHGLVLLFNNGEEDFLNGARVFGQHPISRMVTRFLNLEGAGAGGRATLFRSTDTEITKSYEGSPHPYGSVVSGDGFERGLIASQTDYVIFNGIFDMRGLDVAFFEPRARYHTDEDSTRYTSKDSVWHMLSAALATTKKMTSSIPPKNTTSAVWFDLLE